MHRVWCVFLLSSGFLHAAQRPSILQLTVDQQTLFDAAKEDFSEHHPELALEKMRQLHV